MLKKVPDLEISKVLSELLSEIRKHDTEDVVFLTIEGKRFKVTKLGR